MTPTSPGFPCQRLRRLASGSTHRRRARAGLFAGGDPAAIVIAARASVTRPHGAVAFRVDFGYRQTDFPAPAPLTTRANHMLLRGTGYVLQQ
jgi:hypothetical protein